jgi:triphosphatase
MIMSEQELKLHVPKPARATVKAAMHRGAVTRVRLRAQYFDTPERALVKAGISLRLRQEGRIWVQTLKMSGPNPLSRLELNHRRPDATLDLSVYDDSPAKKSLVKAAKSLSVSYETDIQRLFRRIRSPAGVVEVAFDVGQIKAGGLVLPVSEVEFELVSGQLQAVFLLGLKWQAAHHLILDLRSKAERGDRLAALAQQLAGLGDAQESATAAARAAAVASFWAPRPVMPISLKASMNCEQSLACVTLECLEQIARNSAVLAEVDTASICQAGTPEHVHQLRVGIRRLRSCWSLYKDLAPLPPDAWREAVKDHFCALGTTRDDDVLRESLMPVLNAAGQPPVEFTRHHDNHSAMHLARSVPYQRWLIEMLAWAVDGHPIQTPSALTDDTSAHPANLKTTLKKKLFKWHQRVLSDGLKFDALEIEAKHDLRKRAKRLRYGLQFSESLLPAAKLKSYRKQLSRIQDILGEMNDLYVAREKFEGIRDNQPPAWFAVGWIASRLAVLDKEAKTAFSELKGADHFWD